MNKFKWCVLVVAAFLLGGHLMRVKAQSGQVVFLGATSGTTLAANCPATPTTPSICLVGDGAWVWQSTTTGWFKPLPTAAAGVTSVQQCNLAGGACSTAQTGAVVLKVPQTVAVTVGNPTVSATQGAVTATLQ